jgi:uncharacterized protein YggT (Ycf19 family)
MNRTTKPLTAFFNTMIFFYLLIVFFTLSWNPENWGEIPRLIYVLICPVISFGVYGYASEMQEKNND